MPTLSTLPRGYLVEPVQVPPKHHVAPDELLKVVAPVYAMAVGALIIEQEDQY
jgi:hypothetical protein